MTRMNIYMYTDEIHSKTTLNTIIIIFIIFKPVHKILALKLSRKLIL